MRQKFAVGLVAIALISAAGILTQTKAKADPQRLKHEVVILRGQQNYWYTNLDNRTYNYGYTGFTIYNASTSDGAPQIQNPVWLVHYDGTNTTYTGTNQNTSLSQTIADLLNDGFQIKQLDTQEYGQVQCVLVK